MAIFTLTNITLTLLSILAIRRIYYEFATGSRRRAFAKQHGTLPAPPRVTSIPSWIPTLGIEFLVANYRAVTNKRLLESWQDELRNADAHTVNASLLGTTMYLTDDPENVKQILATGFDSWRFPKERVSSLAEFLGPGIFTNEGAAWKHSREMLRPCFEKHQVADVSLFEKHTERLMDVFPRDGSTVDLLPLFHAFTLDVSTEFLFGRSTGSLVKGGEKSKESEEFVEAFEYCCDPFSNEIFKKWGYVALFLPDKKQKRSFRVVKDFADKIIEDEMAALKDSEKPKNRYIFLDELLAATQDRTTIRSELLNILLAGRDTTAALLSNLFFSISRSSTILSKLCAEINQHIETDLPTYEQLKDLKFLRACINESQRLYPIVPSNSRQATCDTLLPRGGGPDRTSPVFAPKGTLVGFHTYGMHRRPDIFGADADNFRPERWLEPGFRPGWAYVPFSGGPRVCIGQNFALTEVMYVVVRILQEWEVESKDGEVWRESIKITCVGEGGCKVGLRRREGQRIPVVW